MIRFHVQGMTCGGCAAKISSILQRDQRVQSAVIDFATATGVVTGRLTENEVRKTLRSLGYDLQSQDHDDVDLSSTRMNQLYSFKMWVISLALVLPIMVISMSPQRFWWSVWAEASLATVFIFGPAFVFFSRAARQAYHRHLTMDSLIAVGMASAWLLSVVLAIQGVSHLYFESAAMIGFFVLSGKTLEEWARKKSIGELEKLVRLRPKKAFKWGNDGRPSEMPIDRFKISDQVYVRPGDMLALDGIVLEREAHFDESVITGESTPIVRRPGDPVPAGAINASTFGVKLEVTRIGSATTIEQIIRLIEDAKVSKPDTQKLADRISTVFIPVVMLITLVTFLVWRFAIGESTTRSVVISLGVLVVACPCALGLATPVAWVAGLGHAAKKGIILRSYEALETLRRARVFVFDKTGTMTLGEPRLLKASLAGGERFDSVKNLDDSQRQVLGFLVSALVHSSHPNARSLSSWLKNQIDIEQIPASKILKETVGQGVECEINLGDSRHTIKYGKPEFVVGDSGFTTEPSNVNSMLAASIDEIPRFVFEMGDSLREDSIACVKELLRRHMKIYVASGDKEGVIRQVLGELPLIRATQAEINTASGVIYQGDMTPEQKRNLIGELQKANGVVAFVGDGMNDAPGLALADVGIAFGSGSDLAASQAGLVLTSRRMSSLLDAIDLSARITRIIRQNFFWAFAYNVAAIPLAVAGVLHPMWASAAMAMSSLSVVLNALRLRR